MMARKLQEVIMQKKNQSGDASKIVITPREISNLFDIKTLVDCFIAAASKKFS